MRVLDKVTDIDRNNAKHFFDNRAKKYNDQSPYSVTMYQDNNPELVQKRNRFEVDKLLPKLKLDENSKVLDIACGVGRWADAINCSIEEYCGLDFSGKLIDIAKQRNTHENYSFYESEVTRTKELVNNIGKKYNRVLMIGILVYVNEDELAKILEDIVQCCEESSIICIREPIGIKSRLTLKNYFSEELQDDYNAIYRTKEELLEFFNKSLIKNGFLIREEGYLFKDEENSLNNRKETAQYYFIFERGMN